MVVLPARGDGAEQPAQQGGLRHRRAQGGSAVDDAVAAVPEHHGGGHRAQQVHGRGEPSAYQHVADAQVADAAGSIPEGAHLVLPPPKRSHEQRAVH